MVMIFLFASCNNDSQEINEYVYNNATVEEFLKKEDESHLEIYDFEQLKVVDEEDCIYKLVSSIKVEEIQSFSSIFTNYIVFKYYERKSDVFLNFYSEESVFEAFCIRDGHLFSASCSRYYKISEEDSNNLINAINELNNSEM